MIGANARTRPTQQAGSSLLEVLVAILIMSFGLLALGGLTAVAQQYVKMTQFQSIAMALASDLGERMRGNVQAFEKGRYTKAEAYSTDAVEVPTCMVATACTGAEIASIDLAQWVGELRQRLPGGDAFVQHDDVNPLATDIWILWIDPDSKTMAVGATADCPTKALTGLATGAPTPRCMYYRVSV